MPRVATCIVFAFSLVGCDEDSPSQRTDLKEPPSESVTVNKLSAENLHGTWVASREICDSDSEVERTPDIPTTSLILTREGQYRKIEEGKEVRGSYTLVESGNRKTVQLDGNANLSRYEVVEGHLENWGEGEAVYPCALVFQRAPATTR